MKSKYHLARWLKRQLNGEPHYKAAKQKEEINERNLPAALSRASKRLLGEHVEAEKHLIAQIETLRIAFNARRHNHREAFCLMWYRCDCGAVLRAWNSRDGVTPFGVNCPSCGEARMMHDRWDEDEYAPHHKPHKGQLIFRNALMADFHALRDNPEHHWHSLDAEKWTQVRERLREQVQQGTPWGYYYA